MMQIRVCFSLQVQDRSAIFSVRYNQIIYTIKHRGVWGRAATMESKNQLAMHIKKKRETEVSPKSINFAL